MVLYNILNIVVHSRRNSSGHITLNNIEVMPFPPYAATDFSLHSEQDTSLFLLRACVCIERKIIRRKKRSPTFLLLQQATQRIDQFNTVAPVIWALGPVTVCTRTLPPRHRTGTPPGRTRAAATPGPPPACSYRTPGRARTRRHPGRT